MQTKGEITYTSEYGYKVFKQAINVLCSDGKRRRTLRMAKVADTWFSISATIQANGKSITGYLTNTRVIFPDGEDYDLVFIPYLYNKNHTALPEWRKDRYGDLLLPESFYNTSKN